MKMTRAIRRQIHTVDLVAITIIVFKKSYNNHPKKTLDCLDRIDKRLSNIDMILYGGNRYEFRDKLNPKDLKRYLKVTDKIGSMFNDIFKGDKAKPDFFNAILMMVEDTRESVKNSKNKNLKHEWVMLNKSVATLFRHIADEPEGPKDLKFPFDRKLYERRDNDWAGYGYQNQGIKLGMKFRRVIMG